MRTLLGVVAALFILVGNTFANAIPVRTRSDYGQAGSLILDQSSTTINGVTIASQEFCSDAETDPTTGTCQLAFAFQITSTLPANVQSLTLTFAVPSGGTLESAGLLTNDGTVQNGNIFFSPFSQMTSLGFRTRLSCSAPMASEIPPLPLRFHFRLRETAQASLFS
jgi:hypothetical protein